MGVSTRVVILRLRLGGVILLAPCTVLPWPRMLDRKTRDQHAESLRDVLSEPGALQTLRLEQHQLLDRTRARGGAIASPADLVADLIRAARSGLLTVIGGHPEINSSEDRPGELTGAFESHDIVRAAVSRAVGGGVDPKGPLPPPGTHLPKTAEDRMDWAVKRAATHMTPDEMNALQEFFGPRHLPTTVAILSFWGASHGRGTGFVVDAGLFALAVWQMGSEAILALDEFKTFFDSLSSAMSYADLDKASISLARGMTRLGALLFRQILRRVGSQTTSGGGSDSHAKPAAANPSTIAR